MINKSPKEDYQDGYYHIRKDAPICICLHGYRSSSTKDFSSGIKMCFENKFNVLSTGLVHFFKFSNKIY